MSKKKPKKTIDNKAIDKVVLLMAAGMSHGDIEQAAVEKLAISATSLPSIIAAARRKITLAADYNRDEQIGTAVTRLNDIYSRSLRSLDNRTALAAQKELSKLLDIYKPRNSEPVNKVNVDAIKILDLVKSHLIPLGLTTDVTPIDEHARIAAETIRDMEIKT